MDEDQIGAVLAKCAAYDTRFPVVTPATIEAWYEHFGDYPHVTAQDALEAVKIYYRDERADVPRPASISKIARQVHQDVIDRDPDAHAARLEARSNAKAGEPQRQLEVKVNNDPATAEHRRKMIEAFVAAKSERCCAASGQLTRVNKG